MSRRLSGFKRLTDGQDISRQLQAFMAEFGVRNLDVLKAAVQERVEAMHLQYEEIVEAIRRLQVQRASMASHAAAQQLDLSIEQAVQAKRYLERSIGRLLTFLEDVDIYFLYEDEPGGSRKRRRLE